MDELKRLRNIWPLFHAVKWDEPDFLWEKAYVCSVHCSLAYAAVPERGQINTPRYRIIPSYLYQRMFISGSFITVGQVIEFLDLPEPVVIWNRHIVTTIRRMGQVLFVAVRGTEIGSLYDWRVNLGTTKDKFSGNASLHSGFYTETLIHAEEVADKLAEISDSDTIVYITGHSMGGAVAAIMNILFSDWAARYTIRRPSPPYTFGMPRYGDDTAVQQLPAPYAVFHPDDAVPKVPPKIAGFADCRTRLPVVPPEEAAPRKSKLKAAASALASAVTARPVREHFIESYRRHISARLNFDENDFLP